MLGPGKRTWMSIFPKLGFEKTEDEKYKGKWRCRLGGLQAGRLSGLKQRAQGQTCQMGDS